MRVELPYKVYIRGGPVGSPTVKKNGWYGNVTSHYFATKQEALAFCGSEKHIKYAPGEAWANRNAA